MKNHFAKVGGARPGRSLFNLSYEKKFTCDMGQLIPVMCDEVVPGDIFDIGASMVIRFQPLVAPVLHAVDVFVHTFFIPYRLLWSEFEEFITGGVLGTSAPTLPRWLPSDGAEVAEGTLWDYMGFPTGYGVPTVTDSLPMDFPRRAYAFVWNEFFRDETLQDPIAFDPVVAGSLVNPLYRNWEKDYFTSALLWQQRGTAPGVPVTGSAVWANALFSGNVAGTALQVVDTVGDHVARFTSAAYAANGRDLFNDNDISASIDIADLRLGFQIQKWLERNARAGARYTEFLGAHFGVAPDDSRLQRPEYIGGMRAPIIFSEVLQTSETNTTPQGNLAGHGLSVGSENIGKYRAQEFGLILGLMSIMPRPAYQQGINRQWLRKTKLDFYFPEFAHLSEQEIKNCEIFWAPGNETVNQQAFGFCGAYDEMRVKSNMVCGEFRTTYDYWHIGRQFVSLPVLDDTFIQCVPRKDIFAAPSEPGCLVQYGNIIKALRPMPIIAEPGLIDHG